MAVVQAVIMYGPEMWMMILHISRFWGGFHHRVARSLTGRQPRRGRYGGWVYPPLVEAMLEAVLKEEYTYVSF